MFLRFHTITCKKVIDANDKMATITLDRNPTTQEFPMKGIGTFTCMLLFASSSLSYAMEANQAALDNELITLSHQISNFRNFEKALTLLQKGANPDCTDANGISPRTRILQELEQPATPLTPQPQEGFIWDQQRIPVCHAARRAVLGPKYEEFKNRRTVESELKAFLADLPEAKNEQ